MRPHTIAAALSLTLVACGNEPTGGENGETRNGFDLQCTIPSSQIFSGGVSRDGIPALVKPEVVAAGDNSRVRNEDRVLGVVVDGEARAYPFTILWWHELVNDTLGGQSVLVSYCPLTGSGIAFDPTVDGTPREFGVSGLLFENNLVMFDRLTESLWNQMLLGSQCGPERGKSLTRIPVMETTWRQWKILHPGTTVLTFNTGYPDRPYGAYPYGDYRDLNNATLTFRGTAFSNARPPKELVLGVFDGTDAVAFPFGMLADLGTHVVLNDSIGSTPILVTWLGDDSTAVAFHRVVNGQTLTLTYHDPATRQFRDNETGTLWDERGEALGGPLAGEALTPVADAYVAFWFAWSVYYPRLRLVE